MSSGLIDSCVLIDFLRGNSKSAAFLNSVPSDGAHYVHLIVAAELLAGARDKGEQTAIDSFLSGFRILLPDESDGMRALDLYRQFHLSHGVDWPDCEIAATAIRFGLAVYTQNIKHFTQFPGVRVLQPY